MELRIYVRKSQEKKISGKKTLIKKIQFSKVRGQNVIENTVLSFRFLGLFSENNKGAANQVSGNKITGIKVLKKEVLCLEKMRSSLKGFHKKKLFTKTRLRGVLHGPLSVETVFFKCKTYFGGFSVFILDSKTISSIFLLRTSKTGLQAVM